MYKRLLNLSKKFVPKISETESIALKSGTISIERHFFKGTFDKNHLIQTYPYPKLLESSKSLHESVEHFCSGLDDNYLYTIKQIPKSIFKEINEHKLLGMIIPKKYGGLELNHHEQSQIVQKISTASSAVGVTVMVPNSLGPAELLLKYGTEKEKDKYLPKLADGTFVPCFGLTGQHSGSDAASMLDTGVLMEKDGKKIIRINISKRYITLAPISNLVGISFKLSDPNGLLQEGNEGITLALLEPKKAGLITGPRHNPMDVPFPNGTIEANDLDIPLESIIGGEKNAGNGWKMLMECLAVGRSISLPACAIGSAKLSLNYAGAYSIYRKQFKTMLADMEGVQDKLAKVASETFKITSIQYLTNAILDAGEKPSVISAIMKYETTERARDVVNHSMDIVAGAGICKGPNNILGNSYQAIPVGITVEGSNTLTKNLIIFGQGLMKSHPYLFNVVNSIQENNEKEFKDNLNGMVSSTIQHILNSIYYKLITNIMFLSHDQDMIEKKYINNFALTSNLVLLMGKKFKSNEFTSGRNAEILGSMYMIEAMDWFNHHHEGKFDKLVKFAKFEEYQKIQNNFEMISDNYPIALIRHFLRCIHKKSMMEKNMRINDELIKDVSNIISKNNELRKILSENSFEPEKLKLMNKHFDEILKYQKLNEKDKIKNKEYEEIINEVTKVDVFQQL